MCAAAGNEPVLNLGFVVVVPLGCLGWEMGRWVAQRCVVLIKIKRETTNTQDSNARTRENGRGDVRFNFNESEEFARPGQKGNLGKQKK